MRNNLLLFCFIFCSLGFSQINSQLDTLTSGELMLTQEIFLKAPVEKVWDAYTTEKGWIKWVAPVVSIDFKINGKIQSNYNPEAKIGDEGTIVNHILNYIPFRLITMQAEIADHFPGFMKAEENNLYSIVHFEEVENQETKLTLYGIGYKNTEKWHELINFFIQGNEITLNALQTYLGGGSK